MIGLLVGLAIVSSTKVERISSNLETINSVKQRYAINFRGSVHDRAILMRDVLLLDNKAEIQATLDDIQHRVAAYASSALELDAMMAANMAVTRRARRRRGSKCPLPGPLLRTSFATPPLDSNRAPATRIVRIARRDPRATSRNFLSPGSNEPVHARENYAGSPRC